MGELVMRDGFTCDQGASLYVATLEQSTGLRAYADDVMHDQRLRHA